MEDYALAFLQRAEDTELFKKTTHTSGSMHLGGVVVECFLKDLVVQKYGLTQWKTRYNNPGHDIENPGHVFSVAVRRLPTLNRIVNGTPQLKQWFDLVQNPVAYKAYINIRYEIDGPDDADYQRWWTAYTGLVAWLLQHGPHLV